MRLPRARHDPVDLLDPALQVGDRSLLLGEGLGGEDHIGEPGGVGQEEVHRHDELGCFDRPAGHRSIGHVPHRIRPAHHQTGQVAVEQALEDAAGVPSLVGG